MFSGIVETQSFVLSAVAEKGLVRIDIERPSSFTDIKIGDSICSNGVCLTIETFDDAKISFALGAETLSITSWSAESLQRTKLNLERSLRLGDRIHGHMVSGHVDGTAKVAAVQNLGGSLQIDFLVDRELAAFIWKKGSWAVNGVSLTVNEVKQSGPQALVSACLIPETLKRTNLGDLQAGAHVNIEVDMMARGLIQYFRASQIPTSSL